MEFLFDSVHTIISFLVIISVIVFIHEYGHYKVARWCGVRVEQFSIGFGREIWGWNDKHGTRWKLSLLLIGGYVKMFGDADPASSPDSDKLDGMTDEEKKVAFDYKPLWKKALVVVAGPAANYILAIAIMAGFFIWVGYPQTPAVVGGVMEGSAAEQAGLQEGDRIQVIYGREVTLFNEVQRVVQMYPDTEMDLRIERDGNVIDLMITPTLQESTDMFGNPVRVGLIGVTAQALERKPLSVGEAIPSAVSEAWHMSVQTLTAIGEIITGRRGTEALGGPIRIAQYSGQSAEQGLLTVLWFMAVLSLNLGLINLLPIPMLDGGHLMFYAIEAVTGRPLAQRFQEYAFRFGFIMLISLMLFVTVNDLMQLNLF